MLQWNDGASWEHRAYWGANNLGWGVDGTNSRRYMGALPASGQWVRLDVPASQVGLEGVTVSGMAFSMWNGRATWDHAGKASATTPADVQWLVADQLGTPRMIFDKTGSLANTKRHDYLPFGEELTANQGLRTIAQGYSATDGIRQKFAGYEKDSETDLNYAQARYYAHAQGRFTGADGLMASAHISNPQSWNRYSYVLNKPMNLIDPSGLLARSTGGVCSAEFSNCDEEEGGNETIKNYDAGLQHTHNALRATQAAQAGDVDTYIDLMDSDETLTESSSTQNGSLVPDKGTDPETYTLLALLVGEATPLSKIGTHGYDLDQGGQTVKEAGEPKGVEITRDVIFLEMTKMVSVVINRLADGRFGDRVSEVASDTNQFTGYNAGKRILSNVRGRGSANYDRVVLARAAILMVRERGSLLPANVLFWKGVVQPGNFIRRWREGIDYVRVAGTDFSTKN